MDQDSAPNTTKFSHKTDREGGLPPETDEERRYSTLCVGASCRHLPRNAPRWWQWHHVPSIGLATNGCRSLWHRSLWDNWRLHQPARLCLCLQTLQQPRQGRHLVNTRTHTYTNAHTQRIREPSFLAVRGSRPRQATCMCSPLLAAGPRCPPPLLATAPSCPGCCDACAGSAAAPRPRTPQVGS